MARTRSKPKAAPAKESTPEPAVTTAKPLPPPTANPPKLFVLPKDTSPESRIVTLPNPANDAPSRYYFCPNKGFHEFTRIAAPRKECKSWLLTPNENSGGEGNSAEADNQARAHATHDGGLGDACVTNQADLFMATPIDILFLILPALAPKRGLEVDKLPFLSFDHHLEALTSMSRQWKVLLGQQTSLRNMVERRMAAICDTITAGDEAMYKLSSAKLVKALVKKAERMSAKGLPPSMEERFIKTALDVPIMNVLRSNGVTCTANIQTEPVEASKLDSTTMSARTDSDMSADTALPSQTTTVTTVASCTEQVTAQSTLETPEAVPQLLRLRTSLNYLSSSYLPASLHQIIKSSPTPDFSSLDAHLAALSKLRAEALALRSISDNISRKRGLDEDEGAAMEREEKKRRKEEEERKKKNESLAIKKLKKVDTSGMKKLSSFFTKAVKKT